MKTPLKNLALTCATIALGLVGAEIVTRILDRESMWAMPLVLGTPEEEPASPAKVALAEGVSADWLLDSPPPLANRTQPPADWLHDMAVYRVAPTPDSGRAMLLPADMFKAWNAVFVGDPCRHPLLNRMPTHRLYEFDPVDDGGGAPRPAYRYMPDATTPVGLVTNQIGWRGPPLRPRTANTVRIVFVGASTTAEAHNLPYSYPEMIDHWLGLWAASKKLDIDFQALNAGRESMISTDIAAIVRSEVAPLRPDLVVYYEGANQFDLAPLTEGAGAASSWRTTRPVDQPTWLSWLAAYSTVARRFQAAITLVGDSSNGREPEKPAYTLRWPPGVSEADPDLADPNLPVNLPTILGDLDSIRATLRDVDSELAITSFMWLVRDGMVVDALHGINIWNMMNRTYWPWRYRDIARLVAFENRVFAKYAAAHRLPFIDYARDMPFDPELFSDAVHNTPAGVRMHAWVVLQQLIPIIEDRLARGAWPKRSTEEKWPVFAPRTVELACQ